MIKVVCIEQFAKFFRGPRKISFFEKRPLEICFDLGFTNKSVSSEQNPLKKVQHFLGCYFNEVADNASRLIKEGQKLLDQKKPPDEIKSELERIAGKLQSIQTLAEYDRPSQDSLNNQGLTPQLKSLLDRIKSVLPDQSSPE